MSGGKGVYPSLNTFVSFYSDTEAPCSRGVRWVNTNFD